MKISNLLTGTSKVLQYVPFVSTVTSAIEAIEKIGFSFVEKSDNNYVNHIKAKPKKDIALGLIPVVGNLAIATLNLTRWENEKPQKNFQHNREEIYNLLKAKNITSEQLSVTDSMVPTDRKYKQNELKNILIAALTKKSTETIPEANTARENLKNSRTSDNLQEYFAATKPEDENRANCLALIEQLQADN